MPNKKTQSTKGPGMALLFLILFMPFIYSQPFFLPQTAENQLLNIVYPQLYSYERGQTITLSFHLYNSTGYEVLPFGPYKTNCTFHLYDTKGNHIVEDYLNADGEDYEYTLLASLNLEGEYGYIVNCNDSIEAGFVSNTFGIFPNAKENDERLNFYFLIGYFIVISIFLTMIHVFKKDNSAVAVYGMIAGTISLFYASLLLLRFHTIVNIWFSNFVAMLVLAMAIYCYIIGYIFYQDVKDQNKTEAEKSNGLY